MDEHFEVPAQRRERLLSVLRSRGAINVTSLALEFGVSEPTLRRDVNLLAERGLLERVHGGATTVRQRGPALAGPGAAATRHTFGLVVPSLTYYFPSVIRGARAAAEAAGVRLVLRGSEYDDVALDRRQIGSMVASRQVDGLIVAPELRAPESADLLRWLDSLPVPVVLLERQPPQDVHVEHLEWVASDHRRGTQLAIQHLFDQGHRSIGLFANESNVTGAQVRTTWREVLPGLGIDPDRQLLGLSSDLLGVRREQTFEEVLGAVRSGRLTAALVQPDPYAVALAEHLLDSGLQVPGDVALVAYDDEVAAMGQPALSAVRPAKYDVGRLAVETLLARLDAGAEAPLRQLLLRPRLMVRESSLGRAELTTPLG